MLFALDNVLRRVAEHLVGLIRPGKRVKSSVDQWFCCLVDFVPATNPVAPITPGDASSMNSLSVRTPMFLSVPDDTDEEMTRLHQEYTKLAQTNRG